ncbi:bifunctional 4-hydroxy-2-oxoglutarate aldolase/2-dehydro-3-deoxy-phosphogluconate aldolase [Vulcaniibacterium tengchongense]|uniref:2-dehydro-3-deoxy-phosphogluconate aldolase n=1 Tax=Vulcaniibacterium tengchongense TaxID=1273429 RepID=A0A3N4VAQ9_9GAMM|nr:bifunctional 4-hydroxy-2-oxoglutarate aldolase/2-dehydro-3-deoxy-phosphogluconate aldolase [Vulcaniibacterium tengchongense]RPE80072.1 2-dehydro-3-deoxyphosphogluconate aldolase/(4S)-4-hydroxy-2-oxoglutarate aldolase [Vulcaniibacterium tengchongense]
MGLLENVLHVSPVMPVVVIEDARHAVALARALVAGGIPAIEITLRTRAALDAVRAIAGEVEGAIVGVGTVRKPQDLADAEKAGAKFAVSPGATPALVAAAQASALPWLPGAGTASEAMTLAEQGFVFQKFFPAEAAGGAAALRALHGPLPEIRFCATGGIGAHNARDYLATPNVACVGGSWLTPSKLLAAGEWGAIEALARAASMLRA